MKLDGLAETGSAGRVFDAIRGRRCSPRFGLLFRWIPPGQHSIPVVRYILDTYGIDNTDWGSYIPYIEVYVGIQSTRELLEAWKAFIGFLKSKLTLGAS